MTLKSVQIVANGMRNLVNFNVSSGKSENLHFNVLLFSIAYKVSSFITLKEDPKFEEKLTFCLKNDMRKLVNFKIQSENMKMTWNSSLFLCCTIYNFSKCDGFTVL